MILVCQSRNIRQKSFQSFYSTPALNESSSIGCERLEKTEHSRSMALAEEVNCYRKKQPNIRSVFAHQRYFIWIIWRIQESRA